MVGHGGTWSGPQFLGTSIAHSSLNTRLPSVTPTSALRRFSPNLGSWEHRHNHSDMCQWNPMDMAFMLQTSRNASAGQKQSTLTNSLDWYGLIGNSQANPYIWWGKAMVSWWFFNQKSLIHVDPWMSVPARAPSCMPPRVLRASDEIPEFYRQRRA